jgi:t-SNARE complex subunit (syntaxin)
LFKQASQFPARCWALEAFNGASAAGTKHQVDEVLALLNQLVERERNTANRLQQRAHTLQRDLSSLCGELDCAIAARRLRRKRDLVIFSALR